LKRISPRVLVCGSRYGSAYVEAIDASNGRFDLAGILARGSARSQALAARCRRPLYVSVDEIPDGIGIACAAMGRAEGATVLELVRRGTHVLCEHPVDEAFAREALRNSAARGVCFHVNAHFADLPAPRALVRRCLERGDGPAPLFVRAWIADRALYGAADLLTRALAPAGSGQRIEIEHAGAAGEDGPAFRRIDGALGGAGITLTVQIGDPESADVLPDGSPAYRVDCRVLVGFTGGVLALESLAGPLVWHAGAGSDDPLHASSGDVLEPAAPDRRTLVEYRTRANLGALERLVLHAETGEPPPTQTARHLIGVAASWDRLARAIGNRPPLSAGVPPWRVRR
jgi:thiazolinyl imide reductase